MTEKNKAKRVLSVVLASTLAVALIPAESILSNKAEAADVSLSNPRIVADTNMKAGQKVTWDCVWFGSYPQAEVIPSDMEYAALDGILRQDGDVIVSDGIYSALQSAAGWDANNEIILDGMKYRRMQESDAAFSGTTIKYYQWKDSTTYHYFKYEPIKWRVLHTDGNQALLLSDMALDNQRYHREEQSVTWETSTIRSWLNGYGADSNQLSVDYTGNNFIDKAFTAAEQGAIASSAVENADNITCGTEGGSNTADKIFLLSESEVWNTDKAASYGFVTDKDTYDEARRSKSSTYAKARGIMSSIITACAGNCDWWLRSPGDSESRTVSVYDEGWVSYCGDYVYFRNYGVRAALNLNLSSSNLYTYAGTVCSDETEKQPGSSTDGTTDNKSGLPDTGTLVSIPMKGAKIKDSSGVTYTVTNSGTAGGAVEYTKPASKKIAKAAIPAVVTINGITYQVTSIASGAFSGCSKLKNVTIGKNVTTIGAKAFYKCTSLTRITIPAKVSKIDRQAFYGCKKLKSITIKTKKLTAKSVGSKAFKGIYAKASIKVPKGKLKNYKKILKARGVGAKAKIK